MKKLLIGLSALLLSLSACEVKAELIGVGPSPADTDDVLFFFDDQPWSLDLPWPVCPAPDIGRAILLSNAGTKVGCWGPIKKKDGEVGEVKISWVTETGEMIVSVDNVIPCADGSEEAGECLPYGGYKK